MKQPCVYMMASQRNGTLYIGVTSNLIQRVWQHREGVVEGFTQDYGVKTLVWFELHEIMESAIVREKQLKKWNREWKLRLIEEQNPEWNDLWFEIIGQSDVLARHPRNISRHPRDTSRHPREGGEPDALARHPREGGEPAPQIPSSPSAFVGEPETSLDSRLRGNDGSEPAGDLI